MIKIGINGFGRIGKMILRLSQSRKDIEIIAINDLLDIKYIAYMLKYDSIHGIFKGSIEVNNNYLLINDKKIYCFSEKDPSFIDWKSIGIDIVVESTGKFLDELTINKHIISGAKKVILTAPPINDNIPMFVMGVNNHTYKNQKIVSNSSCTTNCLAPLAKIINDNFGIIEGLISTIHAVTATQKIVDGYSYINKRNGRSALHNIIPTSTGAAKSIGQIIPELQNKLTGVSFRVPILNVSMLDLTVRLKKSCEYKDICDVIKHASKNEFKNIIGYTKEDVVSSDFNGNTLISIFDEKSSVYVNKRFIKLISWYDNESGYSSKVLDLISYINV